MSGYMLGATSFLSCTGTVVNVIEGRKSTSELNALKMYFKMW